MDLPQRSDESRSERKELLFSLSFPVVGSQSAGTMALSIAMHRPLCRFDLGLGYLSSPQTLLERE